MVDRKKGMILRNLTFWWYLTFKLIYRKVEIETALEYSNGILKAIEKTGPCLS